jgi:dihydrofolate reductase
VLNLAVTPLLCHAFPYQTGSDVVHCWSSAIRDWTDSLASAVNFLRRSSYVILPENKWRQIISNPTSRVAPVRLSRVSAKEEQCLVKKVLQKSQNCVTHRVKDIWLFGGGNLFGSFAAADLVDTVELGVFPVILGGVKPLMSGYMSRINLDLASVGRNGIGCLSIRYTVRRSGDTSTVE